jgi:colanic acid/amylovoran biosynthesis glycosyltransferase
MVGDGPAAHTLKRTAAPLGDVEFTGWLPNAELRRRMRRALAVCVPSLAAADGDAEGLPNVVLEAMAEGAPVIGSEHAGIPEAVEHERTGLLVPPGDPEALASALRRLIAEPELRRRFGSRGRRLAAERFSAAAQSRRLEAVLLDVIAGAAG